MSTLQTTLTISFRGGWRDGTKTLDMSEGSADPDTDAGLFRFIAESLPELEARAYIEIDDSLYRIGRSEHSTTYAQSVRGTAIPETKATVIELVAVRPSSRKHAIKIVEFKEPEEPEDIPADL